jgi:outer membrane lipoprotein-sorting protein
MHELHKENITMRKTVLSLAVAGILGLTLASADVAAQSLDEVLESYYEAVGGLDNWKALESMSATGSMVMMGGLEAPFTIMTKRPSKVRIEFSFQGMTGIQAYDGETAWMIMPFMGSPDPQMMPPEMAKQVTEEANIDGPLIGWEEDGHQVELVGKEDVEGTEAYKIKITRKSGEVTHMFLDAEYYLPIKFAATRNMQGQNVLVETSLSDYKKVGDLLFAHSISAQAEGAPMGGQTITIDRVEVNPQLQEALFTMPEKGSN